MTIKIEAGKTYITKNGQECECIAVTDTHAWLKSAAKHPGYVWARNGRAISLGGDYDIVNVNADASTFKIEVGKTYANGHGQRRGPMGPNTGQFSASHPFICTLTGDTYSATGCYSHNAFPSLLDLAQEWTETTTVKEVGTLEDIGAKVGDVVECEGFEGVYYVCTNTFGMYVCRTADGDMKSGWMRGVFLSFRIVKRAETPQPTVPVITETITRKRIVPGTYGRVKITTAMYIHVNSMKTADEVTEAIATLTEIRDAMQEDAQ